MKHLFSRPNRLLILLLLWATGTTNAQNLVPNGSFEVVDSCPPHWSLWATDYLAFASGWHSFGDTPDLFHTCSDSTAGVPVNFMGYEPAFDGSAYGGLMTWAYIGNYREFIGRELATPLMKDSCYRVSFRVSLSDSSAHATNGIGVHFTNSGAYNSYDRFPIDNSPHLFCDSVIGEKQGWQTLSWSFVPDSNYTYMVIGNFFNDDHTQLTTLTDGGTQAVQEMSSYYYVDFVVVERSDSCEQTTTGLATPGTGDYSFAWVVPGSGEISVTVPQQTTGPYTLSVTDALGQVLFTETGGSPPAAAYAFRPQGQGLYVVRLMTGGGQLVRKVLVSP